MANSFGTNPITLDTFTSAVDVGDSLFGNSNSKFKIKSIEWEKPTTVAHTAVVTDADSKNIFNEYCVVAYQSVIKYFGEGSWFTGIKVGASGVSSGKIIINLA